MIRAGAAAGSSITGSMAGSGVEVVSLTNGVGARISSISAEVFVSGGIINSAGDELVVSSTG
jgi:hypothetical protein